MHFEDALGTTTMAHCRAYICVTQNGKNNRSVTIKADDVLGALTSTSKQINSGCALHTAVLFRELRRYRKKRPPQESNSFIHHANFSARTLLMALPSLNAVRGGNVYEVFVMHNMTGRCVGTLSFGLF